MYAVYQEQRDTLYLLSRTQLYQLKDGQVSSFATLPQGDVFAPVLVDNSIWLNANSLLCKINLDTSQDVPSLKILNNSANIEFYNAYIRNVGKSFHFEQTLLSPEEQFLNDMSAQRNNIDLYVLSDTNLIARLKNKDFAESLQSEKIKEQFTTFYPPYQELFGKEGTPVLYPHSLFVSLLEYDSQFFHDVGYSIPQSYEDLLLIAIDWYEEKQADFPEYNFNLFENNFGLYDLLSRYTAECQRAGEVPDYKSPALLQTLKLYVKAKELSVSANGGQNLVFNLKDVPYNNPASTLLLYFEQSHTPSISIKDIDLKYYVLNPFSTNKEAALEFLSYQPEHMTPWNVRYCSPILKKVCRTTFMTKICNRKNCKLHT